MVDAAQLPAGRVQSVPHTTRKGTMAKRAGSREEGEKQECKSILLLGPEGEENETLKALEENPEFKLTRTSNPGKAARLVKKLEPDFVLCFGRIVQTPDGNFVLEF